jgi:hypothetical protein
VLAAVPLEGAAAAVLGRFDGVCLCAPDDVEGLVQAITRLYRSWLAGTPPVHRSPESLRRITRAHQAGQLAACLDQVVRPSRPCPGGRG